MKVALVNPPAVQNSVRGVGVYARRLIEELQKIPNLELDQPDFDYWRFDYGNYDLVHFLYFDPFFLTLPPIKNKKTIVSVMDLTPIVLENLYPRGIRGEIKWQIQKFLLSRADHIITISNSAKKDIEKIISLPDEKITVTYLAPSEYSAKPKAPENFGLYVGDIDPNKNLVKLIEALPKVKDQDFKLVLVGKALHSDISEALVIKQKIKALGIEDRVEIKGFVEEKELVKIYQKANMFIHPAIYEGFGFGPLQALSMGLPVICGQNSSLPEVVGTAAFFADVTNPADIAAQIDAVLILTPKQREAVGLKARKQAAKFSWAKTAAETFEVYDQVLGN